MISKELIATNNDLFRKNFNSKSYGTVVYTSGVSGSEDLDGLIYKVKNFDNFTSNNDPYQEHDFGKIDHKGQSFFWKIDYYQDKNCEYGYDFESLNEDKAYRVLTIMLADEY